MAVNIFISHIHEENELALSLKALLEKCFANSVKVFMSDIELGSDWLVKIRASIKNADLILSLFSPHSKQRPWINIETGFGVMQDKNTVPMCCLGLNKSQLPIIYQTRQAIDISNISELHKLIRQIATQTEAKKVLVNTDDILAQWETEVARVSSQIIEKQYQTEDDEFFTPHTKYGSDKILSKAKKRVWLDAVFYPYYAQTGDQPFYKLLLENNPNTEVVVMFPDLELIDLVGGTSEGLSKLLRYGTYEQFDLKKDVSNSLKSFMMIKRCLNHNAQQRFVLLRCNQLIYHPFVLVDNTALISHFAHSIYPAPIGLWLKLNIEEKIILGNASDIESEIHRAKRRFIDEFYYRRGKSEQLSESDEGYYD